MFAGKQSNGSARRKRNVGAALSCPYTFHARLPTTSSYRRLTGEIAYDILYHVNNGLLAQWQSKRLLKCAVVLLVTSLIEYQHH